MKILITLLFAFFLSVVYGQENPAPITLTCNNWLRTQVANESVKIGDLDVPGTQVTVEATINRTAPYVGTYIYAGDVVSKHTDPSDVNYLLRPNNAEVTTSNGYFVTPPVCDIQLNKTYHIALVYDGSTLKFYRNGFLLSQVAASGNLYQNNLITTIGDWANFTSPIGTDFKGVINEVRIWNVARTQLQLQTYMNNSLPAPSSQTGLLAYYTFDNLLNKQGNAAWNGTLQGAATINTVNPNCSFVADSCNVVIPPGINSIINDYTPVLSFNPCNNKITVENAIAYNVGDTVLIIQMKGAIIDSSNTAAFGNITDYKNAGNYEFNYIKSKSGNIIELKNKLTRQYDLPDGKVQLIRVPYYNSVNVSATLTCLPWDGSKGGVLVLNARDTVTLYSNINVSGNGFRGGAGYNVNSSTLNCFLNDYSYPVSNQFSGLKGESISTISDNIIRGKGKLAAGGGGGLGHNSGGGGGGNAGAGGLGGYQLDNCGSAPFDNRGIGGLSLPYSTSTNKIYMGSGGGAGQADNIGNIPPGGGNGGGMVIVICNYLKSNGKNIYANGSAGVICTEAPGSDCHDGMGGGGAGGTVLMNVSNYLDNISIIKNGGNGATVSSTVTAAGQIGPGGGGAGGVLFINKPTLPATATSTSTGGANGTLVLAGNIAWGATPGTAGFNVYNLVLAIDNVLFRPNIDSVRFKDSSTTCNNFDFKGFAFTNTNAIASWYWDFGNGSSANGQNVNYGYGTSGTYLVKLVVTDVNGCKDSIARNVISSALSVEAGNDTAFCNKGAVSVQLHGSGTGTYSWSPAGFLNNSSISNPVATINQTTTFYLTVSNGTCAGRDSIIVHLDSIPTVKTLSDTSICRFSNLVLTTTGASSYSWLTSILVNNPTISNPLFIGNSTAMVIVKGTNSFGCSANDTATITVLPLPIVKSIPDTVICNTSTISLTTTGANGYSWLPVTFLSDPTIASPLFSGNIGMTYYVTGTAANGCKAVDTVKISVNNPAALLAPPGKSLCVKDSVHLNGNNGTNVLYLWSPATFLDNPAVINPNAYPPVSTIYTVKITDAACHFDSSFTVSVNVNALPMIKISKNNDINCALTSTQLNASGGIQYVWNNAGSLSATNIANPIAKPTSSTWYTVVGTDNNGCKNKDSIQVMVKTGNNAFDVPNSFTPNGDNINDCFSLKSWGTDSKEIYFTIYNRFGEKVFETNDINVCWDGKYKGQPAEVGTYVYYARAKTPCGNIVRKGNVVLFR